MDIEYKHILLAIDGSEISARAQQWALDHSQRFNSKLTVLMVGEQKEKFSSTVKFLKEFTLMKRFNLETILKEGDFYPEAAAEAKSKDYSLIILGADLGKRGFLKASSGYKFIVQAPCPTIVLRKENADVTIKNILLPLSNDPVTRQKVPYAAAIALKFNATVHILLLSISTTMLEIEAVEAFGRQSERYLTERGVKYTLTQSSGINLYAETKRLSDKVNSDIVLAMVKRDNSIFQKDENLTKWLDSGEFTLMTVLPSKELED